MNLAELQEKLMAVARAHPPLEHAPYAFEQRVMARLAQKPPRDSFAIWNRTLWQAAATCVAVMLLVGARAFFWQLPDTTGETLAADLENSLYAPFDNQTEIQ